MTDDLKQKRWNQLHERARVAEYQIAGIKVEIDYLKRTLEVAEAHSQQWISLLRMTNEELEQWKR